MSEFDFPDAEFDHEFLALTEPDRYPIENGTILRGDGPSFAVADFSDHVVESHMRHSTALHAPWMAAVTSPDPWPGIR